MGHLVLVGGGHVHLTTLKNLRNITSRGHRVTLVSPEDHHYYSGMGPGMLGGSYTPDDIRFHVKKMVEDRGGTFLRSRVTSFDPAERTLTVDDGTTLQYDVASFNIGSTIPRETISGDDANIYTVKPISELLRARNDLLEPGTSSPRVVVVGGGPAGLEMAGNLRRLFDSEGLNGTITVVAGRRFLHAFHPRVRSLALASLESRGVTVLEGVRAEECSSGRARLSDGREISCDALFLATGIKPPPVFGASGISTDTEGGLLVNEFLQSVDFPNIFGGGDCIGFQPRPLNKVGVYAVRQNPVIAHNLLAALEGTALRPFDPGGPYLLIFNLGNNRAIFARGSLVFQGKTAHFLKDRIDRRFMREFQVSGERSTGA